MARLAIIVAVLCLVAAYDLEQLTTSTLSKWHAIQVDPSSLTGLVLCGYQGWFRTPGDDDNVGWQHWSRNWGYASSGFRTHQK